MKEKINIFMDWIYNKPIHSNRIKLWIYDKQFKAFIKKARNTIPDFITLCHIVNFIRLLKITYFYRYNIDSKLNIMNDLIIDENNFGFILSVNGYEIEVKLSKGVNNRISIKVNDTQESKSHRELSKVEFNEGELKLENTIQRYQYAYLIRLIMDSVCNILVYYYQCHKEDKYNDR